MSEGAFVSGITMTRAGLVKSLQWPLAFSIKSQGQSEGLQVIYITEEHKHVSEHMILIAILGMGKSSGVKITNSLIFLQLRCLNN